MKPTVVMTALVVWMSAAIPAHAQCGAKTTSCRQCHEVDQGGAPPPASKWHTDHALGDFCVDCHGGDGTTRDVAAAHATLTDPFARAEDRCRPCHAPGKLESSGYLEERASAPRPETAGRNQGVPPRPNGRRGASPVAPRTSRFANAAAGAVAAALAVAIWFITRRSRLAARRARRSLGEALGAPEWSPYLGGVLLGVVAALSMTAFGHRLSGGGAYQEIVAPIGRAIAPDSVYFHRILGGAAEWELLSLVGVLLGAFVSAHVAGTFRFRTMPDAGWEGAFGSRVWVRWLVGFAGAALSEFAAGIAGGCTASLAVSGGAALAPGAFVFMASMFAGGIPTAFIVHRRRPGS